MAKYLDVKAKIRKKINQSENELRGVTEATGLRILDAVYQISELLQQKNSEGAENLTQNLDK